LTLSTRWASCSVGLCLGRNPNCSSRSNPRLFSSRRPLYSTISQRLCQQFQVDLWVYRRNTACGHFPAHYGHQANVLPC
jgi:hypothetical protein